MISRSFIFLLCCMAWLSHAIEYDIRQDANMDLGDYEVEEEDKFWGDTPEPVCYPDLGCFKSDGPFADKSKRPLDLAPQSPEKINTTFMLFTRSNSEAYQTLQYKNVAGLRKSPFDANKPTKIICHGFLANAAASTWMHRLKNAFLKIGDYNVILIDWSGGNGLPYGQAASNTRVVGAVIARFIRWLEVTVAVKRERIHLLGHSLGAHISGYVGRRLHDGTNQISRISGLDPAEPYYENMPAFVRLDHTDAAFVDVTHTDGDPIMKAGFKMQGGFGLKQASGHIDFYPNGGQNQPNCHERNAFWSNIASSGIFNGLSRTMTCDHERSTLLYAATIENPDKDYVAYECSDYQEFISGKCLSCKNNRCARMGLRSNEWKPQGRNGVKMYLVTTGNSPYFTHHYVVKVTITNDRHETLYGDMVVRLFDASGESTDLLDLIKTPINIVPGSSYQTLVTSPKNVLNINKLQIEWSNQGWSDWFSTKAIHIHEVEVLVGISQKIFTFKAGDKVMNSKEVLTLTT